MQRAIKKAMNERGKRMLHKERQKNKGGSVLPKEFRNIVLIAFYNKKALGVRYLETALRDAGYHVKTIFFKDFNSVSPKPASDRELELLCDEIWKEDPILIGFSVMSSMYLDTVHQVIDSIREHFSVRTACGGAFASMFPEHFLQRGVDYVIRGDGEKAFCRLADAVSAMKREAETAKMADAADSEISGWEESGSIYPRIAERRLWITDENETGKTMYRGSENAFDRSGGG